MQELDQVMAIARVSPVVNQVQFSPFEYRRGLLDACRARNVALEGYSPLGTGRHLSDRTVGEIAERVGRTPAQVLLRWALQRGVILIPKSTHRNRIQENAQLFDFLLADADMSALDALDTTGGTERAREQKWW
jgi:diketogulonate reductase-like aldo/keto reductase